MPERPLRPSARERADAELHAELVDRLVGLVDRTFTEAGHGEGLRRVRDMLMSLDRPGLRAMIRQMGVEAPEEVSEPEPNDRRSAPGA